MLSANNTISEKNDLTRLIIEPSYKALNGFTLIIELFVLKNKTASSLKIVDDLLRIVSQKSVLDV